MPRLTVPDPLRIMQTADLDDHIVALHWSANGARLLAASVSGPLVVLDPGGAAALRVAGHAQGTCSAVWLTDDVLASGGQDGEVRWWDGHTGELVRANPGGSAWVEHLAVGVDGTLASAAGRTIRTWDPMGRQLREWTPRPSTVAGLQWHPQGHDLAASHYGGVSLLRDDGDERLLPWKGSQLCVAWSPNGNWLAASTQDRAVHLWRLRDGVDCEMGGFPNTVTGLAWNHRGTALATAGGSDIQFWDCTPPGPMGRPAWSTAEPWAHAEPITALALNPRSTCLASGDRDGALILWRVHLSDGGTTPIARWQGPNGIAALAWSPDGKALAVASTHGRIVILSVASA